MVNLFKEQLLNNDGLSWFDKAYTIIILIVPILMLIPFIIMWLTRGLSPKYIFFKPLKYMFLTHLFLGVSQYVLFGIAFFSATESVVLVLNIVNICHSISIIFMCVGVSGEKYWMIPTYLWTIIIKIYFSILLFQEPLSFNTLIGLYYIHSFFSWGRLFYVVFAVTYLFENSVYSVSSIIGLVVSLSQGFGAIGDTKLITIFFILIIITSIIFNIYKPSFIIDNDQTNDNIFQVFTENEVNKILNEMNKITNDEFGLQKFEILIEILFDKNSDGIITINEFVETFCVKMGYPVKIAKNIWDYMDTDKDGQIVIQEAILKLKNDKKYFNIQSLSNKLHAYFIEIKKKRDKKNLIEKKRNEMIQAQIQSFKMEYKNANK
mmetsp:Transcript_11712/g.14688  ORF Transcript_11712/g.14688 Transcript_11712/m.14688 type:complete len:377 (+) Transcript_11712:195-1325(+)